ncbi:major facilitator superfamily domain-containing protein [Amanita rubescens]|nr:major facilitator superfamily domain-containing protein [Amanita rubescens]
MERPMDPNSSDHLVMSKRHDKAPGTLKSVALISTCAMAMVVNLSNTTSVSIALPVISRELNIMPTRLQWLVSAYALSSGCLLVLCGRLADLYGRKLVFLIGSIWLFVFTLACGFAPNELTLDILRGLQGAGAAASIPASLGILANAFPISTGKLRSIAFATFAAGAPIGGALGICVGATLTQLTKQTWRSTFFLSTGLTGLYFLIGLFVIDKDEPSMQKDPRVDWLGATLITVGLVLIIFVLSDGEIAPNKWATSYIIACLILGCTFVGLFVLWQWYLERIQDNPNAQYSKWTPPPLMKLSLWTRGNGRFAVIMVIAFLTWCTFLSWSLWATLYYQNYVKLDPISTMLRFVPTAVSGVLLNIVIGLTIHRVTAVWLLGIGTFGTALASILFAVIIPGAPFWAFGFPGAIFSVFGADFVFASGSLYVAKIVKPQEQSLAGAMFTTMTQLGSAIGLTVTTIIFNRVLARDSRKLGVILDANQENAPRSAQLKAYQAAQWGGFCFCMIATILVIIFFRNVGIIGAKGGGTRGASRPVPQPDDDKSTTQSSLTLTQSQEEKMTDSP